MHVNLSVLNDESDCEVDKKIKFKKSNKNAAVLLSSSGWV